MVDSLRAGFACSLGDICTPMFDGYTADGLDSTQHLPLDVEERRFRIRLGKAEDEEEAKSLRVIGFGK